MFGYMRLLGEEGEGGRILTDTNLFGGRICRERERGGRRLEGKEGGCTGRREVNRRAGRKQRSKALCMYVCIKCLYVDGGDSRLTTCTFSLLCNSSEISELFFNDPYN